MSVPRIPRVRTGRERGAVLPFVAVALVAILAMAALALDMGHAYVNKTRLQNVLDASALASAKVLDETGDVFAAETTAYEMFSRNAALNPELADADAGGDISVTVQFSDTLNPFNAGSVSPKYVRVRANGFVLQNWLAQVIGHPQTQIAGSAVAGPRAVCPDNQVPLVACGDPNAGDFGFQFGESYVMKVAAGDSSDVGPGNFYLRGDAPDLRTGMACGTQDCGTEAIPDEEDTTLPGNKVGPVVQGLNTRFGIYTGPMSDSDPICEANGQSFPAVPDRITKEAQYAELQPEKLYSYEAYRDDRTNYVLTEDASLLDYPDGAWERRILAVAMMECSEDDSGRISFDPLGFGCFFLLDPVEQKGNEAQVYAQFVETCGAKGTAMQVESGGSLPQDIVLYKDPDSEDS